MIQKVLFLIISNYVYLYGKQIHDFHHIKKDKIFTINFSTTQEIDKNTTRRKNKISSS